MKRVPTREGFLFAVRIALGLAAGCSAPTATRTGTGQVGGAELTAVYSRASKDYVRGQNPDGSFVPETYVFRNGGNFGGPRVDVTMDTLSFEDVTRVIVAPLASRNYVPSKDPAATDLLIAVYWGVTIVPNDLMPYANRESVKLGEQATTPTGMSEARGTGAAVEAQRQHSLQEQAASFSQMEAAADARTDAQSANILGYTDEIYRTSPNDPYMNTLKAEVEQDRYYVVLLAYDYRAARKLGVHRLLWETRFSIPELGNDFEKAFPMMASIAGKYFGQDSHGLVHHNLGEGRVEVGETKSLGTLPEK
jgi:hypothetical protein